MAGKDVEAETVDASESSSLERTVILAIDTSASMRGTRIAEAKKAALAYLEAVPANVQVGVLTFDDTVDLAVPPGLDRDAARSVVSGLQLTRDTSLYDGVLGALEAAGPGRRECRPAQDPGALRRQGHHQHVPGRGGGEDQGVQGAGQCRLPAARGRGERAAERDRRCRQGHDAHHGGPSGPDRCLRQGGRRPGTPDRGDRPGAGRLRRDQLERAGDGPDHRRDLHRLGVRAGAERRGHRSGEGKPGTPPSR